MSTFAEQLGKKIIAVRESEHLTQRKLCERADISPTHMSNIENGKVIPSTDLFLRIAKALNVSADELLSYTPSNIDDQTAELMDLLRNATPNERAMLLELFKVIKSFHVN